MAKIKITSDILLKILQDIMNDEDINSIIDDVSAPLDWRGKTVQEVLNCEYRTFKHRPVDTEVIVQRLIEDGKSPSSLYALTRAFCLMYITNTDRVFSRTNDNVTVSAGLEFYVQSEKVKLLENIFEDMAIATCGERIEVKIGNEERQVLLAFGTLDANDVEEVSEFGEMSSCYIQIDFQFSPNTYTMSDYSIDVYMPETETDEAVWVNVPISSISFPRDMTQKAVPSILDVGNVSNINLSCVKTIVLTFDGYKNNRFIDDITKDTLKSDSQEEFEETDNNKSYIMKITRGEYEYTHIFVVKQHLIQTRDELGVETHSLTLTKGGIENGTT